MDHRIVRRDLHGKAADIAMTEAERLMVTPANETLDDKEARLGTISFWNDTAALHLRAVDGLNAQAA